MTACIAVYNSKTRTGAIAADSGMGGAVNTRSRPKIRQLGDSFVASAGALSGGQFVEQCANELLQGGFSQGLPGAPWVMAHAWRAWCIDRGHVEMDGGMRCYPSHFLILSPHGIFEICRDGEVLHHPPETESASIGVGASVCMGAVHALTSIADRPDFVSGWHSSVARTAVNAAIDLCDGRMGPVQVCVLEAPEPPKADPELGAQVLKLIAANNIDRAIKICDGGGLPFAMACRALLLLANHGEAAIQGAFAHETWQVEAGDRTALAAVYNALLKRAQ